MPTKKADTAEEIYCQLLDQKILKSRCDSKKYKFTIPPACKECKINQLIESNKELARKNLRLAYAVGRRAGLLEQEKRECELLKGMLTGR